MARLIDFKTGELVREEATSGEIADALASEANTERACRHLGLDPARRQVRGPIEADGDHRLCFVVFE